MFAKKFATTCNVQNMISRGFRRGVYNFQLLKANAFFKKLCIIVKSRYINSSIWFDTMDITHQAVEYFSVPEVFFIPTNSVDLDEISYYVVFYLGLHYF